MKDERSEVLRGKAARYMYAFTLIFLGLTVVVLQVLENYGIIQGARWVVVFLGLLFFAELILARLIYRWLDKNY